MTFLRMISLIVFLVPFILAGCGGGGGNDTSPQASSTGTDIGATGGTSGGTGGTSNDIRSDGGGTSGGIANTGTGAGGTSATGGGNNAGTGGSTGGGPAGAIVLAWDAAPSPAVGYKVYYGTRTGTYTNSVDVGNVTTYTLAGLTKGQNYYIAASAYDSSKSESAYSDEVYGTAK